MESTPSIGGSINAAKRYVSPLSVLLQPITEKLPAYKAANPDWMRTENLVRATVLRFDQSGVMPELSGVASLMKHVVVPGMEAMMNSVTITDGFVIVYNGTFIDLLRKKFVGRPNELTAAMRWIVAVATAQCALKHPMMWASHPTLAKSEAAQIASFVSAALAVRTIDKECKVVDPDGVIGVLPVGHNIKPIEEYASAFEAQSLLTIAQSYRRLLDTKPDEAPVVLNRVFPASLSQEATKRSEQIDSAVAVGRSVRGLNAKAGTGVGTGEDLGFKMEPPKVPYLDVLRRAMRVKFSSRDARLSWRRTHPTFRAAGIVFPAAVRKPSLQGLLVAIDVSSSAVDYLGKFLAEISGLIDAFRPSFVTVLYITTSVVKAERFDKDQAKDIRHLVKPVGHGGTDVRAVINWINEPDDRLAGHQHDEYAMWMCFTDGETPWPTKADVQGTIADTEHFWIEPFEPDARYYGKPETGRVLTID